MPSSGGSVSDAPTNKVVKGQKHYLAYITPDEGKSLVDQGGNPTMTNEGVMAYPPDNWAPSSPSSSSSHQPSREGNERPDVLSSPISQPSYTAPVGRQDPMGGREDYTAQQITAADPTSYTTSGDTVSADDLHISIHGEHSDGTPADIEEQNTATANVKAATYTSKEDSLIDKFTSGAIDKATAIKSALKLGLTNSKKLADTLGITTAFSLAMGMGGKAQQKAITWDLNRKLNKAKYGDKEWYDPEEQELLEDQIRRANLPSNDPDHYSQTDYTRDYPGPRGDVDTGGGDNDRGLVNIITPYAAHAVGGTTPVDSMAAQWYSTLGSSPSNPGAFNLTSQYAAAKAAVSQRLGTPTSVGQLAVNNSPFYNWLKDNSLNKGIL